MFVLDKKLYFPPVELADADGLLAIGGDLSLKRILLAYRNGIFPWYSSSTILWWSPDPRFVLFPAELKISRSTRQLLLHNKMKFTTNKAFADVIHSCKVIRRPGQEGTWITDELENAFIQLHKRGYAHSAEVWDNNELAGGLYGIKMGNVFFGESMFSRVQYASRLAFVQYVQQLQEEGLQLIDCQVYTKYLEGFGARMIPRAAFIQLLKKYID
jgi:leucyl/phenylalanyl-tRNA--protein transferase